MPRHLVSVRLSSLIRSVLFPHQPLSLSLSHSPYLSLALLLQTGGVTAHSVYYAAHVNSSATVVLPPPFLLPPSRFNFLTVSPLPRLLLTSRNSNRSTRKVVEREHRNRITFEARIVARGVSRSVEKMCCRAKERREGEARKEGMRDGRLVTRRSDLWMARDASLSRSRAAAWDTRCP